MTGLDQSRMDFGIELLYAPSKLSSTVPASALGAGLPATTQSGSDWSDPGAFPLPSFGWVYKPQESPWTFGLGVYTIGGFAVNYPGDRFNPVLSAPPPQGLGLGPTSAQVQILQIAPAAAIQLPCHVAIGFAPTITMASLTADPALFASPDDADRDGFRTFPAATHSRITWGAGFQVGVYATPWEGWQFGASVASPQWFETFRYHSADEVGNPRTVKFRFDYPMIVSVGAAYAGFDRLLLAVDLRYIDYQNTKGFGPAGFDSTGAGTGLGWQSVFLVALGAQYQLTDCVSVRAGYSYNQNPIPDAVSSINVESPPIWQHVIYLGASYKLTPSCTLSASYLHAFHNSISGPLVVPGGPVPGTSVQSKMTVDALALGLSVLY